MKRFGKMIEEAAREQGVSVAELARALGKNWSWVPQVFRGKNITEKTLRDCVRALGLELRVELVPSEAAKRRIEAKKVAEQAQPPRLRARRKSNGRE